MPRKPRIFSSTGIYHIILRSVNQHVIFEEDSDYQKFLFILADCKKKYDVDIYAYCIMDNHIHILLFSPPDSLSGFFQSLGTRFARWYNCKYLRTGHLFQERYHSIPVENERYFLCVLAYIHNNPVKANMCRFSSEYRWSSAGAYLGAKNTLVNVSYACDIAGSKELLRHFLATFDPDDEDRVNDVPDRQKHFYTDEKAIEIFKAVTKLSSTGEASNLIKSIKYEYIRMLRRKGLTVKQVARIMDVSQSTVKRIYKMNP